MCSLPAAVQFALFSELMRKYPLSDAMQRALLPEFNRKGVSPADEGGDAWMAHVIYNQWVIRFVQQNMKFSTPAQRPLTSTVEVTCSSPTQILSIVSCMLQEPTMLVDPLSLSLSLSPLPHPPSPTTLSLPPPPHQVSPMVLGATEFLKALCTSDVGLPEELKVPQVTAKFPSIGATSPVISWNSVGFPKTRVLCEASRCFVLSYLSEGYNILTVLP